MKTCNHCDKSKPESDFGVGNNYKDGLYPKCKSCATKIRKDFHAKYPGKHRDYAYRKKYGITLEDKIRMVAAAGGRCESCGSTDNGKPKSDFIYGWCIDHCHRTGRVRGILCVGCNAALGQLKESPDVIVRLLNYANERCK